MLRVAGVRPLVSAVCLALAACGGGGGGSGSGTGGGGGGGTGQSMIPTPPAPGQVLFANATDLRPLRDTAAYSYHGTFTDPDSGQVTYYAPSIAQAAGDNGQFVETAVELLMDADTETQTVFVSNGSVMDRQTDPLGVGSSEVATYPELRSPVRVNDQYTQLEEFGVTVGDLDGDGTADTADIAMYAVVVGNEDVSLPDAATTLAAVRVDTMLLVRATLSSTGLVQPIVSSVYTTWYAPGVGPIRRTLTAPVTSGTGPVEYDEHLSSWDGVTGGLGALGPTPAVLPPESATTPGQLFPDPLAATVVGQVALVAGNSLDAQHPLALTMGVFDSHGRLQSVQFYPDYQLMFDTGGLRLHGIDDHTALLSMPWSSGFGTDLHLQAVDATGTLTGTPATITLGAVNAVSAWDGQSLWVAWETWDGLSADLHLQAFTASGLPLGAAQILDSDSTLAMSAPQLVASGGRVLATWRHVDTTTTSFRYATARGSTSTASVFTLGTVAWAGSDGARQIAPVLGDSVAAIVWKGPIFTFTDDVALPETQLRGVTLDGNDQPVRSTSGPLDDELLPALWNGSSQPAIVSAHAGRIVATDFQVQQTVPWQVSPTDLVRFGSVSPGSTALATAAASGLELAVPSGTNTNVNEFGLPVQVLQWDDRALVFGDDFGRTMTALYWLP